MCFSEICWPMFNNDRWKVCSMFHLWKVFINLRSKFSRFRTFCISRHFTAVSSLLAGLMRWAVCLQTRISCLSSGGNRTNRVGNSCWVHGKCRLFRSVQLYCSVSLWACWGWGSQGGYKDVFSVDTPRAPIEELMQPGDEHIDQLRNSQCGSGDAGWGSWTPV